MHMLLDVMFADALNNYAGNVDPDWRRSHLEATRLAAEHPGKLTLIFRHGPGPHPTYAGFSSSDADFVVMPGFDGTVGSHPWRPSTWIVESVIQGTKPPRGRFELIPHTMMGNGAQGLAATSDRQSTPSPVPLDSSFLPTSVNSMVCAPCDRTSLPSEIGPDAATTGANPSNV